MLRHQWLRLGVPLAAVAVSLCLPAAAGAQSPPTVIFQELAVSLDPLVTRPIEPLAGPWSVIKFVGNATGVAWTDFHIKLQVWNGSEWVGSGEGDGISFGQPTPFEQWLNSVQVDINGAFVGGWHVVRTNAPIDTLDFFFDSFVIPPGATLSLHFDMVDLAGTNTWRLEQVPTVPEPGTWALWVAGLGGVGWCARRRRADARRVA